MAYKIHIGNLIHDRLSDRGSSVTWLAKKINCDRTNVYSIFHRETIDVKRLYQIGQALEYDFLAVLSEQFRKSQSDGKNITVD